MGDVLPEFSDYIVFVDESGSPTLSRIDPEYPIFVLVLCVFKKAHYTAKIQPAVSNLKLEHFGHDTTVLHSSDIRKKRGDFKFLIDVDKHDKFTAGIDRLVADSEMEVIAHVVDKRLITGVAAEQFTHPANDPYYVALRMALFSLFGILWQQQQGGRVTHIIAEARGKFEDRLLKSDFNRHLEELKKFSFGEGRDFHNFPIELLFAEKKSNSAGLQLADLIGHPIGRNYLNPQQKNHAFEIVRTKLYGRVGKSP